MLLIIKMGYNIKIKLVVEVGKKVKTFQTLLMLTFLIWNSLRLDAMEWPMICLTVLFLS